jgi:hypothetical protein
MLPIMRVLPRGEKKPSQTRGTKQHSGGGVLPIMQVLPRGEKKPKKPSQTRGTKQHSGGGVLPLPRRSLLKLLRGLLRSPLCLITRLLPHRLPPHLRRRRWLFCRRRCLLTRRLPRRLPPRLRQRRR